MKFILTCGGTAGHVNPALAVAGKLRQLMPDCDILFLGAEGQMEMDLVPREGYPIKALKITNISREHSMEAIAHNIGTLKNVALSKRVARRIIRDFKPDAVIGTGGYVCYPVLTAAAEQGIATLVHESNAMPGLTTRMLAEKVDVVMVGFEESRQYYSNPDKVIVTGTPVRGEFGCYTKNQARLELGLPLDKKLVVSVWGSLGAGHMNNIICQMIPMLEQSQSYRLIHAAGSRYYNGVLENLSAVNGEQFLCSSDVREYIYDMPRVMAAADLLLCRAGASTISELSYTGTPVIMIPSPNVTDNHQEKNARVLERAGGAKVLLEGEFDASSLFATVGGLLQNEGELERMSAAMASLAVPDATDRICGIVLDLIQKKTLK